MVSTPFTLSMEHDAIYVLYSVFEKANVAHIFYKEVLSTKGRH